MTEAREEINIGWMAASPRRRREWITIEHMLVLYCRAHHGRTRRASAGGELCPDCRKLRAYAARRLEACRFGETKPACADCPVHCYKPDMRAAVREVMRWSGPRMLWHHPILAIAHLLDGRRPAPPRR